MLSAPIIAERPKRLAMGSPTIAIFRTLFAEVDKLLKEPRIVAEISQRKQQPGKAIVIFGSPSLTRTLAQFGLIDEYQLTVSPVLLGRGTQFFAPLAEKQALQLLSNKVFASGALGLHYQVTK